MADLARIMAIERRLGALERDGANHIRRIGRLEHESSLDERRLNAHAQRLDAAQRAKEAGIAQAHEHSPTWVDLARATARDIARARGTVTADDVREVLYPMGIVPAHYNAWGAVFRKGFRWTGWWRTSRVVGGHGNQQRVWRIA